MLLGALVMVMRWVGARMEVLISARVQKCGIVVGRVVFNTCHFEHEQLSHLTHSHQIHTIRTQQDHTIMEWIEIKSHFSSLLITPRSSATAISSSSPL